MKDYNVPVSICPVCEAVHDGAADLAGGPPPEPGNITVCIRCAAVLRFDTDMSLALMSATEAATLPPELWGQIEEMRAAIEMSKVSFWRRGLSEGPV